MKTYFFKHLKELQLHILLYVVLTFFLFIISYIYSNQCIYLLIKPLLLTKKSNYLIFTDMVEVFIVKILLSLTISLLISTVFSLFQFFFFFAPGLYKRENILLLKILISFLTLLVISSYLIFTYLIPNIWKFFIDLGNTPNNHLYDIHLEPKLYNYILFITKLLILTSIIFQYPFLIFIFLIFKKSFINNIVKFRKVYYIITLILASFIAPPDVFSQIIIFIILLILNEVLLLLFYILNKN